MSDIEDVTINLPTGGVKLTDFVDIVKDEAGAAWAELTDEDRAAVKRAGSRYMKLMQAALKGKDAEPEWQREMDHVDLQVAAWSFKAKGVAKRAFYRAAERLARKAGDVLLALALRAGKTALGLPV